MYFSVKIMVFEWALMQYPFFVENRNRSRASFSACQAIDFLTHF
jgi:hypothetical protein